MKILIIIVMLILTTPVYAVMNLECNSTVIIILDEGTEDSTLYIPSSKYLAKLVEYNYPLEGEHMKFSNAEGVVIETLMFVGVEELWVFIKIQDEVILCDVI
jgi:hypothetical protein